MSSFALFLSEASADSAAGWQARWQVDSSDIGQPIAVPLEQAQALREFTRSFERAFDHRGRDGRAPIPHFPADAIAAVGGQLYELCCAPVWGEVKTRANGSDHRLVVHTRLADALNLPWELLPLARDGAAIGCDRAWSLYRTPLDELPDEGAAPAGPLKILFLAAAPIDQGQLDYEREEDAILRATDELRGAVLHIAELGSFDELKKLVAQTKPHVVHLSGHGSVDDGGTGRFCFEDERGRTDAVTANRLVDEVFRGSGVRCVFLNACQTSQAAVSGLCQEMVAAGLPLALGWAASVADDRATRFAETFYRELLAGDPVPAAVALARLELQEQGLVAQATPVKLSMLSFLPLPGGWLNNSLR